MPLDFPPASRIPSWLLRVLEERTVPSELDVSPSGKDAMSTLEGEIIQVSSHADFGFVNNPRRLGGYTGPIPQTVFVHARNVKKRGGLYEGMSIAFDARENPERKGKFEAINAIELSRR